MYYNGAFIDNFVHYQPASDYNDPNHAVAIVGWDDTKVTAATNPGAWLIKNSWGADWGEEGYFWISYYDKHSCQQEEMGAISFINVQPMPYDRIYYHDYHGWRKTLYDVSEAINAFAAEANESLVAVSFFTAENDVDYTVGIYDNFSLRLGEDVLTNKLSEVSGHIEYSGFHTIELTEPLNLTEDDNFFVYVSFSQGGHPYDATSEVPVLLGASSLGTIVTSTASSGESFYHDGTNWVDLTTFDVSANFCIKALAVNEPLSVDENAYELPSQFELYQNYPNPFNPSTTIRYRTSESGRVKITVYNSLGEKVQLVTDSWHSAGTHSVKFDARNFPAGVYFYNLSTDNGASQSRKMILLK